MHVVSILILVLSTLVFLVLATLRLRGNKETQLFMALSAVVLSAFLYGFFERLSGILPESSVETGFLTIKALWWFCLAVLINAGLKQFVFKRKFSADDVSPVPLLMQHLTAIFIYLIALMIVLQYVFGQSITAVATASGAIALIVGYSSRTVLEELFSGLALYANEPFKTNHLVQVNGEWYYVVDINWRATTFLDMDQNTVLIPNTTVASAKNLNLDQPSEMTRRTMFFEFEYNIPPKTIVAAAEAAMKECAHVADHPWNFVWFYSFEKSGMKYKAHFHITHYNDWYVASDEFVSALWYRFSRMGIRFAHQRHLNYKTDIDEKKGLRNSVYDEANYKELVDRFSHIPIFEDMTDQDMEELVQSAPLHILGPPEHLTYAGTVHNSMFLIVSGEVHLFEVDAWGGETQIMAAGDFEFIGLMSLLTGVAQRTTIRATKETLVCEITSEALHALFERKPHVMEKIAGRDAKWQIEEEEALSAVAQTRAQESAAIRKRKSNLSRLITEFFKDSSDDAGA
jgi:small-conductance mechanosensitive channel/CRP-like cAMP-binding protein